MGQYDVIIIGAGPAGLLCAAYCGREGLRTLVLEKNAKAGRKLLLTGAGRCNLTHDGPVEDLLTRYGDKDRFVKPALLAFTNDDLVTFIEGRGLWTVVEAGGKVFPAKGDAHDVLRALLDGCRTKGVTVRYGEPVKEVGPGLEVRTGKDRYRARTVVIATGGRSYPGTGSTGDGYSLARALGHTIVGPSPALAPVIVKGYLFDGCAGISLGDVGATVFRDGKKVHASRGDVLLTHKGLSGPGILDLSRHVRSGDVVRVALVDRDAQTFERELVDELAAQGKRSLRNVLARYDVPERLLHRVLEVLGIPRELKASQLDKRTRRQLAEHFTGLSIEVERTGGYDEAMVTRGGVSVREIGPTTMGSRKITGLYFAGEVVDVDGDTGGYNLQFAFSSGVLAAKSIARALEDV
ncbi:MAG: NAD(P)/FAD-dependent oxidoreductase [Methanopyri archaeon]|nr:NAD(P)/FAD-dependent oxidoreductase [Methanopyri archaeon]